MVWKCLIGYNSLCSAYFRFKTKIGKMRNQRVSHVKIFRPKKSPFLGACFMRPLCCHFYNVISWNNFVIFQFEFAQESKKFQKMDIDDVQKSICRNLFVKIDALLGVLRNFLDRNFGDHTWCRETKKTKWGHTPWFNTTFGVSWHYCIKLIKFKL